MSKKEDIQLWPAEKWYRGLKEIPHPPRQLFYEGKLPSAEAKFLCIVGSRKFSTYGRQVCQAIVEGLRGYPIVIVSGLAVGIDAIAHQAALDAGLETVAIPGSGLSRKALYPKANTRLADAIVEHGGALISEYKPDFLAMLHTFPERNRLMVAISDAVLIIEAGPKSGTLITARLATDYNKDVWTVPGSIFSTTSDGPNMLLKTGARPITSSGDILEAFGFERARDGQKMLELSYHDCSDEEKRILGLMDGPIERDELIRRSGQNTHEVNSVLTVLELKGLIKEAEGHLYRLPFAQKFNSM